MTQKSKKKKQDEGLLGEGNDEVIIEEWLQELLDEGDYQYKLQDDIDLVEVFAALEEKNLFLIN